MASFTLTFFLGLTQVNDHADQAVRYSLHQDKELPRYEDLLRIFGERWQVIDDLLWQMATERGLDDAVGVQLDGLGDILDLERGTKTDDEYRMFLRAKILVLRSHGRVPNIIEILQVLGVSENATVSTHPVCCLRVSICHTPYGLITSQMIGQAKAAGVELHFLYTTYPETNCFTLADDPAVNEHDADRGLENIAATNGGRLSYEVVL